jgi:putative phosphoesterase
MKLAILSDIHANLTALDCVLSDIEKSSVNKIVCLGDVAELGPQPHEVIERLRKLGGLMIMGNEDEALLEARSKGIYRKEANQKKYDIDRWAFEKMTKEDLDYIRSFERTFVVQLFQGDRRILFCHGSPRSNNEQILSSWPSDDVLLKMVSKFKLPLIVVCGHTHVQMFRKVNDSLIFLNPGSVGMPFKYQVTVNWSKMTFEYAPKAEYALISLNGKGESSVEFRSFYVDSRLIRESIRKSRMPHAEWLASHWRARAV